MSFGKNGITYQELLREGQNILKEVLIEDADVDSFLLLEYVTGMNRGQFFLRANEKADAKEIENYKSLLQKRREHIPLQHITGEQEFMGLPFYVNEHVLVPRQDTECLVEISLPYVKGKKVLDMCTGSGCIAVSLMLFGDVLSCHAVDVSEDALEVARRNIERNQAKVEIIRSDLFEKVTDIYDVIVSNPPYIPPSVIKGLSVEVKEHEPMLALDGGEDGLDFYRKITKESKKHLVSGGFLFYEIGCEQAAEVMAIMQQNGFAEVKCKKDYAGNDRVVYGRLI